MTKEELREKYYLENMTSAKLSDFIETSSQVDYEEWKSWPGKNSDDKAIYLIKEWEIYEIY